MTNEELTARLKAFALMLKYGQDLFEAKSFGDVASLVVNNSRRLLNFRSATLLEISNGVAKVVSQYGLAEANPHSQLAVAQARWVERLKLDGEPKIISASDGLPEELSKHNAVYCCLKLKPPANLEHPDIEYAWLLNYENTVPAYVPATFKLVASSASNALYFQRLCKSRIGVVNKQVRKRWVWIVVILLVIVAMFMRVSENITAEFTLVAPQITGAYAWFDGPIAECLVQDGTEVKEGELIVRYETDQLAYRLSGAKSALAEIEAELVLEQQNSFTDEDRLGRVKLLEVKRDTASVAVQEAQWYLDHAEIRAPADGIIALADGRAEQLAGRAVHVGDKLFEVMGGKGMTVEIPVNERESSVLRGSFLVTLFLHTAPETAIPAKVQEVSQYAELSEQRTYCYMVRAELSDDLTGDLRYGMRGIAHIDGGKVSLGYRLFKSVVLYFREW